VTGRLAQWASGGPGRFQHNLVKHVAQKEGVQLTLLGTMPPKVPNLVNPYPSNVAVHAVRTTTTADSFGDLAISNLEYPFLAFNDTYDIVHFNILPGLRLLTLMAALKPRRKNTKYIGNMHGAPGEIGLYNDPRIKRMLTGLHWKLAQGFLKSFDSVVVLSNRVRKDAIHLGIAEERLTLIPNAVPDEIIRATPLEPSKNVILCYGNFYPIKGQDLLIRAYARSQASRDHKLMLVGRGNPTFLEECKRLAATLGVEDKVLFSQFLPWDRLIEEIPSSKVCVFPSRFENASTAILEAMSLGRPIIATSNGGTEDYAEDQKEALLINPLKIDDLSEALDKVCYDQKLRERLGANAVVRAKQYTWSRIAQKYIDLYLDLYG